MTLIVLGYLSLQTKLSRCKNLNLVSVILRLRYFRMSSNFQYSLLTRILIQQLPTFSTSLIHLSNHPLILRVYWSFLLLFSMAHIAALGCDWLKAAFIMETVRRIAFAIAAFTFAVTWIYFCCWRRNEYFDLEPKNTSLLVWVWYYLRMYICFTAYIGFLILLSLADSKSCWSVFAVPSIQNNV